MKHDPAADAAPDAHRGEHAGDDADEVVAPGIPGPRRTPLSVTMDTWAPIAAGVIRAVAGVIAFSAALLTLPTHVATPFLTGVGLLMLVGGCVSVVKACQFDRGLRWFAVGFPVACGLVACVVVVIVVVFGAGAFAPDLFADPPAARPDDGTVRFESN